MKRAGRRHCPCMVGYSLIELIVVVGIIGIIAAFAYPGYRGYVCDTYRSQAVVDLHRCALALDRYQGDNFTYVDATVGPAAGDICFDRSPAEGAARYALKLTATTVNNYALQAIPEDSGFCEGTTLQLVADGTLSEL